MTQGWLGDDYYILFTAAEAELEAERYGMTEWIPGCALVGLKSWDDFLVRDGERGVFTVPVVPLDRRYLQPAQPPSTDSLTRDQRLEGKLRWWVKPLAFGGDARDLSNTTWVSPEQHVQLVRWWNEQYRAHAGTRT